MTPFKNQNTQPQSFEFENIWNYGFDENPDSAWMNLTPEFPIGNLFVFIHNIYWKFKSNLYANCNQYITHQLTMHQYKVEKKSKDVKKEVKVFIACKWRVFLLLFR